MKLAVISPIPHLQDFSTTIHLVLAHWILEYPQYAQFYRERSRAGEYVILDNCSWEHGISKGIEELYRAADFVEPAEIVLPDVMRNARNTVALTECSLPQIVARYPNASLMGVAHGETPAAWDWCMSKMIEMRVDCLGIPRCYSDDFNPWKRAVANTLHIGRTLGYTPQIHLLGSPINIAEAGAVEVYFPGLVRSTDTSKPIHYALNGFQFTNPISPDQNDSKRPKTFITDQLTSEQISHAHHNLDLYKKSIGHIEL